MIFFNPDDTFVKWISDYANGRLILDVGCGQGHLLHRLSKYNNKIFGIDCFVDYFSWVEKFKEVTGISGAAKLLPYSIETDMIQKIVKDLQPLILLCRPCHSQQFIRGTYLTAAKNNLEMLYIGLKENIEDDLRDIKYERVSFEGSSEDEEVVLRCLY